MENKISVIVPVYNVEPYLRKCLDSIVQQTYSNLQIILIDDGSTDAGGSICDEYAARDPRIQVMHKPNGGLSSGGAGLFGGAAAPVPGQCHAAARAAAVGALCRGGAALLPCHGALCPLPAQRADAPAVRAGSAATPGAAVRGGLSAAEAGG